jgi:hypothetical protein
MTPDMLKNELDRAEDAELQSDEQLRQLVGHIDKACTPNPTLNASDCAKTIAAALALNERLRERTNKLRLSVQRADGISASASAVMQAKLKAAIRSNP